MSDPTISDIDFKNQMAWAWTTLKPLGHFRWFLKNDQIFLDVQLVNDIENDFIR